MHGLVIGKFMPPHAGHEYLIRFAESFSDKLTVVVCSLPAEPISGDLRFQWMRVMFPNVNVVHLTDELPQHPSESEHFWDLWREALLRVVGSKPDVVFTSEAYGEPLAGQLGAEWISPGTEREAVPISGTEIRSAPWKHWAFVSPVARTYFRKTVVVFGPESTGKTTLAKRLADCFDGGFVAEYARGYLEQREGEVAFEDLLKIGRGQVASQSAIRHRDDHAVTFCDTDVRATPIWSEAFFSKVDPELEKLAATTTADLYLLCRPDVPFVDDAVRYFESGRDAFFDQCVSTLSQQRVVEIGGDWEARWSIAVRAVENLFS